MIYFVQSVDGGPVKIGTTGDLDSRLQSLSSHYQTELVVLATMDGDLDTEREIHGKFSHLRLGRTEQFRPAPDLMEFIGRPLFVNQSEVVPMAGRTCTLFAVKGYPSWFEWLKAAADHEGLPVMNFIDLAVKDRAKRNGFDQPMPRRVGRSK